MKKPKVTIEDSSWNMKNGLRITVRSDHDSFSIGRMYSVSEARYLALKLNEACDEVERDYTHCKSAFLSLGKKLGFIDA